MESILKKVYYNPRNPGSFGGVQRLLREVQKKTGLSRKDVEAFLLQQNTYTLHKDRRWRFPRNKVIALFKDEQWQADLAEMPQNNGYRYILVVIDVFTKYVWATPLKRKDPESVREGFKQIFKNRRIPCKLQTDRGKEFDNKIMRPFYEKHNILYFTSTNKTYKCSVVERLNRTLKGRMYRYFTSIGKRRWIDKLQDFVDSYNNSYHTSIKMTPTEASEADNAEVFRNLYVHGSMYENRRLE
jgi:integrase-like protein